MNKPEDMFDIVREDKVVVRKDGSEYRTWYFYLIYKPTGKKHFPKSRQYGYSDMSSAVQARTKLYKAYTRSIEESLLGN